MNPNSISSTDTKQICLKLIQSSPWATKKKMDLESHVGVLQYHWAVHQIPQPIVDVLICAVQDTLSNVNSYVHIKWHWPCVLKMCSKTPEQKHYRILPNRTAPPIEPPQLYSEVIEDNFLFKTLFTDWKSDHFWPRYGHFCVTSNTATPNHCFTARRLYWREYGIYIYYNWFRNSVYCPVSIVYMSHLW